MNKVAVIKVSFKDKTFTSKFPIDNDTKEYEIADEAYRVGIIFADTQIIATYGHRVSPSAFAELLRDLDYTYEIKEAQ